MPRSATISLIFGALLALLAETGPAAAEPRPARIVGALELHPDGRIVRLPPDRRAGAIVPRRPVRRGR